nr:u-box domain-containing protein 13 [Quercus suber]
MAIVINKVFLNLEKCLSLLLYAALDSISHSPMVFNGWFQAQQKENKNEEKLEGTSSHDKVFGNEHNGCVRGVGFGPTPSMHPTKNTPANAQSMEEEKENGVVRSLIKMANEISSISEYRCMVKKHYCNLVRRLKLLIPLFEEIRDTKELVVPEETMEALKSLREALESAKDLLRFGCEGSKIYLVRAFP